MEFKYKIGDKVKYYDNSKDVRVGVIDTVEQTYDGKRNLYAMYDYGYLRYEEEIIGKVGE